LLSVPLLARVAGGRRATSLAAALWLVGSFGAVRGNLSIGQANALVLLCLCGAAVLLDTRHEPWGGALVAAAALCKPNLALVLLGLAASRRWQGVRGMVALPLLAGAGSLLAFGAAVHGSYLRSALDVAAHGHTEPGSVSLKSSWLRLLDATSENQQTPLLHAADWVAPLWVGSVVLTLRTALVCSARRRDAPASLTLSLWIAAALLVAPRSHGHDVVWTLVPIVVLLRVAASGPWWCGVSLAVAYVTLAQPGLTAFVAGDFLGLPLAVTRSTQGLGLLLLGAALAAAHLLPAANENPPAPEAPQAP